MPDPEMHPNLFGWAAIAGKFKDSMMNKWPAGDIELPSAGKQADTPVIATKRTFFCGTSANKWENMLVASGT